MNGRVAFVFRKLYQIGMTKVGDDSHWNCAKEGDSLVISPKKSQAIAPSMILGFLGTFMALSPFLPGWSQEFTLQDKVALMVVGGIIISLVPIFVFLGWGEWRFNSEEIEFRYYFRSKSLLLLWKDVERLRMGSHRWVFQGKGLTAFIPLRGLSRKQLAQVKTRLEEILSPHFDLTVKSVTAVTFMKVVAAPCITIIATVLIATHLITSNVQGQAKLFWLLGLFLTYIGVLIIYAQILRWLGKKDNPWRVRCEH